MRPGIEFGNLRESWRICHGNSVDSVDYSGEVLKVLSFFLPGNVFHCERSMVSFWMPRLGLAAENQCSPTGCRGFILKVIRLKGENDGEYYKVGF